MKKQFTSHPDLSNTLSTNSSNFKAARINEGKCSLSSYNRKDFYKISLVTKGKSNLIYRNEHFFIDRPALVLTNQSTPYSWQAIDDPQDADGYFCVFTKEFIEPVLNTTLQKLYLAQSSLPPLINLNSEQSIFFQNIFISIRNESNNEFSFKYDLIKSYLNILLLEALKIYPQQVYTCPSSANTRISERFFNLIESQFPPMSANHAVTLKKPKDYATELAVHVNHLNAALQEITGKSTTEHINDKLVIEAKSLLKNTDWTISEISYSLGFEYASYFNNFFKKHTSSTPLSYRKNL